MNRHLSHAAGVCGGLLLIALPRLAQAQVNIEAIRKAQDKQGLSAAVGGHVTSRTGNLDGLVAGGSGRLQLRHGRHLSFLYATGNYARWNHKTTMSKAMTHLRYNYEVLEWLTAEAFFQLENNRFQKLTHRELLGAGPRFDVWKTDTFRVAYGTSAMLEWEELSLAPQDPSQPNTLSTRWNHYLTWAWQLDDRLCLESTTYVQPKFTEMEDFRVLHEGSLDVGITDRVSAKIGLRIRYDSEPPLEVKRTDIQLTNGFSMSF